MNKVFQNEKIGLWDGIDISYLTDGYSYSVPRISPNGELLAYLQGTETGRHLFIKNLRNNEVWQLSSRYPLSTGTAYGGGVYCWGENSDKIYFSSKGILYEISVKGGKPREIYNKDKAFAPVNRANKLAFSIEHKDSMSLAVIENDNWPYRLPIDENFIYDADINPKNGDIAAHVWSFPNMSWDGSKIIIIENGSNNIKIVAGGDEEATSQPQFSPNGEYLAFHSDKSGWLNLWIANSDGSQPRQLVKLNEEHAYSTWVTGERNYTWIDNENIVYTRNRKGFVGLSKVNIITGEIQDFELPEGNYTHLTYSPTTNQLACSYSDHKTKGNIQLIDLNTLKINNVCISGIVIPDRLHKQLIKPVEITYPTIEGDAHGMLYAVPDENGKVEKCPTIFIIHGGPTGMVLNRFQPNIAYFVTRGWAVFAVNHRGSIGYGREYRQALTGNWGILDVQDTIAAVKYLVKEGYTDEERTAIMGGSAGGYTTLMVLAKHPGIIKAGVDLYGVSDLFGLSEETHYLESNYDTMLVGPLPESAERFFERSPLYISNKITDPLLILQGEEDPVVPKNQSEKIAKAVKGYVEFKLYPGESHGFNKSSTLEDMYPRIDKFLRRMVLYKGYKAV